MKINKKIIRPRKDSEAKLDFFSFVGHQLKGPLSTMKLSLEMLLNGDFGKISKEQKDIIEKTLKKNKVLISIIKDLLDIAKIETEEYSSHWKLVDIKDLVESVVNVAKEEIQKKKIKLEIKKNKIKHSKTMLDKERMFLAIQNIVDNAVKYTPVGGKVNISFNDGQNEIEIKIQDSGIGIPKYQKDKLFSKFFRGSNAKKIESSGSGLGLFIAKHIIEAHNGKISFISEENKGTTFTVALPIHLIRFSARDGSAFG